MFRMEIQCDFHLTFHCLCVICLTVGKWDQGRVNHSCRERTGRCKVLFTEGHGHIACVFRVNHFEYRVAEGFSIWLMWDNFWSIWQINYLMTFWLNSGNAMSINWPTHKCIHFMIWHVLTNVDKGWVHLINVMHSFPVICFCTMTYFFVWWREKEDDDWHQIITTLRGAWWII